MTESLDELDSILNVEGSDIKDVRGKTTKKMKEDFSDLEMTDQFKKCHDLMEKSNENLFLSGDAGTGKSTLVKYFMHTTDKKVVVVAPTGVAAVNAGGCTIHSFFKFPPAPLTNNNIRLLSNEHDLKVYDKLDTIIIDEISMVRTDVMDAIDTFLQMNLNSHVPFAGKQIIMVGDLNQLPPVVATSAEREMMEHRYDSEFFFDSFVLRKSEYTKIALTKIYRQSDPIFIGVLNKLKNRQVTQDDIDFLNQKCLMPSRLNPEVTNLCATNKTADYINESMLSDVKNDEIVLEGTIQGNFNPKNCPVDNLIRVKIGCRVMILTNDAEKKYFNGSVGVLKAVNKDNLVVEIKGVDVSIARYEYVSRNYTYSQKDNKMNSENTGTFVQYPIRLAYAITIHKSQGLTLDRINIDLGNGAFAHGQFYIAISRARTLEGVTFTRELRMSDIIYDRRVSEFMKTVNFL